MISEMFVISLILLIIAFMWLSWWMIAVVCVGLFYWWLYTFSPRHSLGGYSFLAPTKNRILALTFTGGNSETLDEVVNWLDERNISTMFFVYGRVAKESPLLMKDIIKAGHVIGIAGFESKEKWFTQYFGSDDIHKAIHRSQEVLADIIPNFHTVFFRPYRGRRMILSPWRLKYNFGYYVVLWSFELGRDALQKMKNRMIINVSLDDTNKEKLFSQLSLLEQYVRARGYQFVQIEV